MAIFKFDDNDVFINTLEAYPEYSFYIVSGTLYIDNYPNQSGSFAKSRTAGVGINTKFEDSPVHGVPEGYISLYESNINRPSGSVIYSVDETRTNLINTQFGIESRRVSETDATGSLIRPFVVRDGYKHSIKTYEDSQANALFDFGDLIEGSYQMSASITQYNYTASSGQVVRILDGYKNFSPSGETDYKVKFSIKNVLRKYQFKSPHMKMITEAPLAVRDLRLAECAVTNIPSIFYGKKIKPGTVELNYYITGSLIGTLKDVGHNGELVQTYQLDSNPTDYSGAVQGVILYNEGLIILTASHAMGPDNNIGYVDHDGIATGNTRNKWTHFGSGWHPKPWSDSVVNYRKVYNTHLAQSASYEIKYQGVSEKQTLMMMSYAKQSELNWSNNPTFVDQTSPYLGVYLTSSNKYVESDIKIANITDTQFDSYTPEQRRETYITKVAIYDDKKNLIGVASLANPVRKTEDRKYTFKLKIDL